MSEIKDISIILKWSGKEYQITDLTDQDTVKVLRHEIFKQTQVRPERQKLLNLKYKGEIAEDSLKLGSLEFKPNYKLMMVGSTEAAIEDACQKPDDEYNAVDDLEIDGDVDVFTIQKSPIYLAKIQKRIKEYKITELNPSRPNKNLLVLDVGYTFYDHRSVAETEAELIRPHLHEFLTCVYENYDIAIWSETGMGWIEEKMRLLGVSTHPSYKIMFYLDSTAMITVHLTCHGVIDIKPLGVIWGLYPQYSATNTIMLDDIRRNFIMNPQSGLGVRPFSQAHLNRATDDELLKLSKYLTEIALRCKDFTKLNHRHWEYY